ncbi:MULTISPECIES: hypothetical protein [Pseudomonas]|jgi:hypothetical protein|uniref:Uncharacterized protein n=1 Tax=Pseudomonas mandelii TaxID=75612 RepID=A0A1H2H617_9PSED|nr:MULTISPECIES: hypothetical protein [Pseudomonas]MBA4359714.1 hypothetical protein [Pseudomonas sp.]MBU0522146.1 hypothetical protein [Gammaproteobacteria bacterium]MDF9883853.1 hypothetical protein [Pseudomonas silensiensis]MBU0842326.1 hypothetical protein [Gammaproteobacteria bacterium]MBU1839258.1 hypothetical protein [Gammaproteobacteria bacterium]
METSKGILLTVLDVNKDGVQEVKIEFVTRETDFDLGSGNFSDTIVNSYAVLVSKKNGSTTFNKASVHGDIDQDGDIDMEDEQLLFDLANTVIKFKASSGN